MTYSPTCSRRKPGCPRPPPASPANSEIAARVGLACQAPVPALHTGSSVRAALQPPCEPKTSQCLGPARSTSGRPPTSSSTAHPDRAPGDRDGFTAAGHLRAGQLWGPVSLGASEVWVQTQRAGVLEGASVHRARGGAPVSGTPRATGSPGCPDTTACLSEGTRAPVDLGTGLERPLLDRAAGWEQSRGREGRGGQ